MCNSENFCNVNINYKRNAEYTTDIDVPKFMLALVEVTFRFPHQHVRFSLNTFCHCYLRKPRKQNLTNMSKVSNRLTIEDQA